MKRLLMLLCIPTMIIMAAPAYADDPAPNPAPNNDEDFAKQLTDAGVTYQDPKKAVAAAKVVCELLDNDQPKSVVEKNLESRNGFTDNGAHKFMILATAEYCPKHSA
ncbi:hypothetical protein A5658_00875 [Mycobacterium sp. 1245111.1]|uniref:DUF732 domain-containing protein n=1 Tax=Mycobacterium sp. 1245111.1 TaxID=1834073 RepID=UPI0007FD7DFC|nr:DUF732 domain-containing protein [Mycobacterium sp. 1245111.1]OBK36480.1 hypothetical protein A5658_00875 [Mycobacterium sp. 1245111.1]